jgi:hypothetical protein
MAKEDRDQSTPRIPTDLVGIDFGDAEKRVLSHYPDQLHESHKTRISMDASSYDEICTVCGATDGLGTWGRLRYPCLGSRRK